MNILFFAVLFIIARVIDAWIRGHRYKQKLEREAREVEEKCAGKPAEEQIRIRRAYLAKLEAEVRRLRGSGEPQKRRAVEPGESLSAGTKAALLVAGGIAAAHVSDSSAGGEGGTSGAAGLSAGCDCCDGGGDCGCDCG
ncbi:MAG: hypothetical protein IJS01_14060 [Lentisphaeria bacterium]|nr:hypothetical protein [Lentisphaeria bacterium]